MKRAIRVVLLLLSLWVLSGGIAEKEAIKQQALEYMKGKYGEEFVVDKIDGRDRISQVSGGTEIWMYPKIKVPEKDYTSDMEIYVQWTGEDGKFHESYDETKYAYELWKYYTPLIKKSFKEHVLFYVSAYDEEMQPLNVARVNDKKQKNIDFYFTFYVFKNSFRKNQDIFLSELSIFIKKFQIIKNIKELTIRVKMYNEEDYMDLKIEPKYLLKRYYDNKINYSIKIEREEFRQIKESNDIKRYIK